jgi:hypothetical protein
MQMAYNGALFVAVQTGSSTATSSPDGITWTTRTLSTSGDFYRITGGI